MSLALSEPTCDAMTSIAVASPVKGLSPYNETNAEMQKETSELDHHLPLPPISPACLDSNEALFSKLMESLEALRGNGGRADSGSTSPSPLMASTGGSNDLPIPSSPAEYELSPDGPLSREQSVDDLAKVVQQLSLAATTQQRPLTGLYSHNQQDSAISAYQQQNIWPATTPSIQPDASQQQTALSLLQQQQQITNANLFATRNTQNQHNGIDLSGAGAAAAANNNSNLFVHPTAAAAAAYQTLYNNYTNQYAQAQLIRNMFTPSPPPVYEECLVGIDGAYQNYCCQIISEELNIAALLVLSHVKAAQLADSPAISCIIGKRYFCSLKEVSKVVGCARVLLIAPDVRPSATAHIKPVRLLRMVIATAEAAGVPYVFCLSRRGIGQVFGRDKSMSIVAIMHVDGVENEYLTLLDQAARGREEYVLHRGNANPASAQNSAYENFGGNYMNHRLNHQQQQEEEEEEEYYGGGRGSGIQNSSGAFYGRNTAAATGGGISNYQQQQQQQHFGGAGGYGRNYNQQYQHY